MAVTKLTNAIYDNSVVWQNEIDIKNKNKIGILNLNITGLDNTSMPVIGYGSVVDVNGKLVVFDSVQLLSGTPVDGVVNVRIDIDTQQVEMTNDVLPSWDESRKGYYDILNRRYILTMIKSGDSYTNKIMMDERYNHYANILQVSDLTVTNLTTQDTTISTLSADASLYPTNQKTTWSWTSGQIISLPKVDWYDGDGWYLIIVGTYSSGSVVINYGSFYSVLIYIDSTLTDPIRSTFANQVICEYDDSTEVLTQIGSDSRSIYRIRRWYI